MYPISLSPGTSLRVRLAAAPATSSPRFTCTYADTSPQTVLTNQGSLNGSTAVVVAVAPSAGQRIVRDLIIPNRDTAAVTVIYETFNGTTASEIWRWTLEPGDVADLSGVFKPDGSLKSGLTGATGPANSLAIGTVTTGVAGSNASATITGTPPSQALDLTIPRGDVGATGATGPANSLAIGTVTTGVAGSNASATITGNPPSQTLDLTIPRGDVGASGVVSAASALGLDYQPSDPAAEANKALVYAKTNGLLYKRLPNGDVSQIEADPTAEITAAISAHEALSDPHPGYLTSAEANAAYAPIALGVAATQVVITASLAVGANEQTAFNLSKAWVGLTIQTSVPAEIRLYQRVSDRAADASRPTTTTPTVRVLQVTTSTGSLTLPVEVKDVFGSTEAPRTAAVPVTIFNRGSGAAAITLTFTYLPLEL